MQYRDLGRTGWRVSASSFGAWAIGGAWGKVDDTESMAALHAAVDQGVNFFDTADGYGDGHSERLLAHLRRECSEEIIVATKAGRRLNPHIHALPNADTLPIPYALPNAYVLANIYAVPNAYTLSNAHILPNIYTVPHTRATNA